MVRPMLGGEVNGGKVSRHRSRFVDGLGVRRRFLTDLPEGSWLRPKTLGIGRRPWAKSLVDRVARNPGRHPQHFYPSYEQTRGCASLVGPMLGYEVKGWKVSGSTTKSVDALGIMGGKTVDQFGRRVPRQNLSVKQ